MPGASALLERFSDVRRQTERLAQPLSEADAQLQSMPDASPAKWHLAHTTWFFETFLLPSLAPQYRPFHESFGYLFNSYYNGIGEQYPRERRGMISRPSLAEVAEYRRYVSEQVLAEAGRGLNQQQAFTLELGIHHEQQHQELLLTDIKHGLYQNPLLPAYRQAEDPAGGDPPAPQQWLNMADGLYDIGWDGAGFCFDNETPRHPVYLAAYQIANRPVTNAEYLAFIEDGGYRNPLLWLADGWAMLQARQRQHPLYWRWREDDGWQQFTLTGERPVDPAAPVCHLSYFEANAFAHWAGARLPGEAEWEQAVAAFAGERAETAFTLHPLPQTPTARQLQLGGVWEWTQSSYQGYPGYRPFGGKAGEYNGKFMSGQYVLRGGSCVTPPGHIRPSYRNFFYPHQDWQFSGLRLCRDR